MKKSAMNIMDYPPPPPPPPPSKRFSKTMIAGLLVIILVALASAGAYYAMTLPHDNNPGPEPSSTVSPSTSPQTSPSPTLPSQVTTTPVPSQTSTGFRDGAWANYTTENYDATGAVVANYDLSYVVSQGTFKGSDCWVFRTELKLNTEGSIMKTVTTYWLDKSDLQGLHYRIVITSNDMVISDTENDYSPGDFNDIPTAIKPSTVVSKETVSVPAGTFNCDKAVITQKDLGKNYVTTIWGNSNIPVIGMAKQTMTQDGVLISSKELIAYGG
jgi:hypothetical protein